MAGSPLSKSGRVRRNLVDGGLVLAVLAGGVFVLIANRERPALPWPPASIAISRAAVARDPLDPAATRNLGLALTRAGDLAGGDRVMNFTAIRTRRDTPTSVWVMVRRLAQGRYDEAFAAADALLRRDLGEGERERLFKLLIAAAHYDVSRPALIARLAEASWWRLAYMRELAARADPADTRLVLAGLASTANPPAPLEVGAALTRLIDDKAYAAAALDWRAFSKPRHDPEDVGDLSAPPPFGWSDVYGDGASSGVKDGALRIDYDGYATPKLPTRLMALPPGRYTTTWRQRGAGDDVRALAVSIVCAGTGVTIATSGALQGRPSWRPQSLDFDVPAADCEGQSLSIIPIPGDHRSTVTAWFAGWTLARR